ncbi:hypothetical protein [Streptomyces sp. MUM 178J]|uniref:hypothetical protein n=1 Tax=Streptomyces sp. MUM 178J TaxID=2791991 RepID=UPI001F045D11|nr:hypothetical protein [Streptomyces sp. MUM 178J]WRQ83586.1 hypothetical protein I3F59_005170 [Streptomyces sp. MUM 178J]
MSRPADETQTGIGQFDVPAAPLQIAMVSAALADDGRRPTPPEGAPGPPGADPRAEPPTRTGEWAVRGEGE